MINKYLIPHLDYGDIVILYSDVFGVDWKEIKNKAGVIVGIDIRGLFWQALYLSFERNEFIMAVSNELLSPKAREEVLEIAKGFLPNKNEVQMSLWR